MAGARRAARAVRHRRHAAPGRRDRARAGRARSDRRGLGRQRPASSCRSRRRAAPTPRSRARSCCCAAIDARAIDDLLDDFREAAARRYVELVPDDLSRAARAAAPAQASPSSPRATDVRLSLVTGNLEPIARLKLARAGIGPHSRPGRAASGPTPRTAPTCRRSRAAAPRRGTTARHGRRERTVVVGDTPRDIACARADGAHVVARHDGPVRAPTRSTAPTP